MNKSADLCQMFFNSVNDAVFVFDAVTKTLIEANSQALRDTGYETEEIKELPVAPHSRSRNTGKLWLVCFTGERFDPVG